MFCLVAMASPPHLNQEESVMIKSKSDEIIAKSDEWWAGIHELNMERDSIDGLEGIVAERRRYKYESDSGKEIFKTRARMVRVEPHAVLYDTGKIRSEGITERMLDRMIAQKIELESYRVNNFKSNTRG